MVHTSMDSCLKVGCVLHVENASRVLEFSPMSVLIRWVFPRTSQWLPRFALSIPLPLHHHHHHHHRFKSALLSSAIVPGGIPYCAGYVRGQVKPSFPEAVSEGKLEYWCVYVFVNRV